MDYAPLSALISDLLSGDRARQHAAITQHVSEDVKFSHILGTIEGRDALLGIYRLCGTVWDYKVRRCGALRARRGACMRSVRVRQHMHAS